MAIYKGFKARPLSVGQPRRVANRPENAPPGANRLHRAASAPKRRAPQPPIDHWKFMQKFYDMGSSFDRLADLARVQSWVESDQLQAAKEAYLDLIRQIGNRMILPEKVDVKGTLERGRQVAEQDIWEGR